MRSHSGKLGVETPTHDVSSHSSRNHPVSASQQTHHHTMRQHPQGDSPLDPSLAPVQELLNSKFGTNNAGSQTETEEESIHNGEEEGEDQDTPTLQHSEQTSSKGSVPSDQYTPKDTQSSSETIHHQEKLISSSFSSKPFQKFSSSRGGRSSVAKSRVSPRISDSDADDPGKEILKDIEQAVMKSSAFIKEFKRLADSGSSDPDSDNDRRPPAYRRKHHPIPPRMAHKVMEQVKQMATPTPVELHEVYLERTEQFSDFGFSVSDGLIEPGIFIRTIKPNGLAELSGQLKPYDRILKVQ